jgi:hypothetical protein
MDMKILKGTIFGGIAYFFLGWLIYGMLLMEFMKSNSNQCANRPDMEMIWWAMIASCLVYALFLTLFLKWSGSSTWLDGLKTGALFGCLFAVTIDLSFYSMTTMYNGFTPILVDVIAATVSAAITGLIIVLLWGKAKTV